MTRLELDVAWRYMRSRKGSRLLSFISVIAIGGVIVGVSALIFIIGVMNGLQQDLRDKILLASPDIRVLTWGMDLRMPEWRQVLEIVKRDSEVTAAAPVVMTQGMIQQVGSTFSQGAQIVGIEPEGPGVPEVTRVRETAQVGDFRFESSDGKARGIAIGQGLADRLGVGVGSMVTLFTLDTTKMNPILGMVPTARTNTFEVTGLFLTGMYEYDSQYAYISLAAAQEISGLGDAVTAIEVRTVDRDKAPAVAKQLVESTALSSGYRAEDWVFQNHSLFSALKLEKLGMAVILLLIVIVAAFNIVTTLTMLVADKVREIGILRAMGMTSSGIRRIFFAQGMVVGAVGTVVGVAVGLAAAYAVGTEKLIKLDPQIYFIDHLPVATDLVDVLMIVVASMAIAALATLYPSAQAAKLFPVDAIRHE